MTECFEDDPSDELIVPSPPTIEQLLAKEKLIKPRPLPSTLTLLIPQCYREITKITPNASLYSEDTLLYIFYNFPGDKLQVEAYNRLIELKYYYSKQHQCFITFTDPPEIDNIKRTVMMFDPYQWSKIPKEVVFDDEFINSLETKEIFI
ncbi:putative NOT transcription complex subunit VIP2 [Astathelohania contejeani]|uniref:NOT transcription complex subunit VIP2 n=1 Tax=Astathelohania contejeani TaxID=164912 RepID=A0ABQ7HVF8_9MICR|nr:putative NOT transcription complex subunit VIP2 [Thelohania contejeani]